jgi:sulfatase modifying factor 1
LLRWVAAGSLILPKKGKTPIPWPPFPFECSGDHLPCKLSEILLYSGGNAPCYSLGDSLMKSKRFLLGSLLLLCCGTFAALTAEEPLRRWRTRFGGVLTGSWDRSLDEPDGTLIRIRSQSNLYRVRVDDLSPEDRWYVLSQHVVKSAETPETSPSWGSYREMLSPDSAGSVPPKPLPPAPDPRNGTAPIPADNSDWGISNTRDHEPEVISTDESLDAEFIPVPESPETDQTTKEDFESLPPSVPGKSAGERRVYHVAGIPFPFRWCPPGSFVMGSPVSEIGRSDNEMQREVTFPNGFWVLETEVTQEMWTSIFNRNPSWYSETGTGASRVKHIETGMLPVEQVTWKEAVEFCNEFRNISGLHTVLPTEAEWEYACRAGSESAYSFGDIIHPEDANYDDSDAQDMVQKRKAIRNPYPVGSFEPNKWGLFDMHGNVAEWCRDSYRDPEPDSATPSGSPELGENAAESEIETSRVFRGGAWYLDAGCCRSAYRYGIDPDTRAYYLGFRMVIEP